MQYQMSGASVPSLAPKPASAPPISKPAVQPPKSRGGWYLLIAALVIGGIVYWARQSPAVDTAGGKAGTIATRTVAVTQGRLEKTLRLTGTTGAENFVSLITPILHGSRGGGGRDTGSKTYTAGANTNLTIQSNSGKRGSSSPSTSSSTAASGDASSSGSVSSTAGASGNNQSAAMQASTSRVSKPSGGNAGNSPSSTSTPTTSTASGPDGIGSTASSLAGGNNGPGAIGGGGGGGGGGGEFGLVLQNLVKPGSLVKKGEQVAEFDRQYMLTRLDDYKSSVSQTEASVIKLKAEMAMARKAHDQAIAAAKADLEKAQLDIKTTPVLGAIEAERLKLALEEANAKYKQVLAEQKYFDIGQNALFRGAELDLQQAKIELKRAQTNADRMLMKSAIGGLTVMQNTFRGSEFSQIKEGDQLYPGQPFMQIVDTRSMVINATVSQVDVEKMRIGLKARVRFDAYPDLELPAHVYAIAAITKPGGMRANYVKDVPVRLKMDGNDARVIPDLSVSVDVIIESEDQAIVAPLGSVFSDGPGKANFVYVKNADGWERRDVQLGLVNYTSVSIKSGLKPGEVIAAEAPQQEPQKQG